jgi:hypothetical protein
VFLPFRKKYFCNEDKPNLKDDYDGIGNKNKE